MLEQIAGTRRLTVGGTKAFNTADLSAECRHMQVMPHTRRMRVGGGAVPSTSGPRVALATHQPKKTKRIEECFGWLTTIALLRKVRHRGFMEGVLAVHLGL